MKLKLLPILAIAAGIIVGVLIVTPKSAYATSYSGTGYFTGKAASTNDPPSIGTNDVLSGSTASCTSSGCDRVNQAIPSCVDTNQKFIDFILSRYNGTAANCAGKAGTNRAQDRAGAAFIIQTMRGLTSGIAAGYPNTNEINNWKVRVLAVTMTPTTGSYNRSSFHDPSVNSSGTDDVFFATYSTGTRPVLVFHNGATNYYTVEMPCANPIGGLPGLPPAPTAKLVVNASVTPTPTVSAGGTAIFTDSIVATSTNTGADTFTYRITSSGLPAAANKGPVVVSIDPNGERVIAANRTYSYNVPASTPVGTKYCRTITVSGEPTYVVVTPQTDTACVTVSRTTVRPTTSAAPVGPIPEGSSTTFNHGAVTTSYIGPPKTYTWTVYQWTNISAARAIASGVAAANANNTIGLNANAQPAGPGVTQICESLQLSAGSAGLDFGAPNPSQVCVPVTPNANLYTDVHSNAGGQAYVEPEQVTDAGHVWDNVTGTPNLNNKEWGYIEQSKQLAPYKLSEAEFGTGANNIGSRIDSYTYGATGVCRSHPTPSGWVCDVPTNMIYACAGGDSLSGSTCTHSYTNYHWSCTDPGYRDMGWSTGAPTCNSRYSRGPCQNGWADYWAGPGAPQPCADTWRCQYADSPVFVNRGQPQCEYRCSAGTGGDHAALASSGPSWQGISLWGTGDLNCYRPWQFTLHCDISYTSGKWLYKDPANGIPASFDVAVNPANAGTNLCERYAKYYGEMVGDTACIQISSSVSGLFDDNNSSILAPDHRMVANGLKWATRTNPASATQCFQTIARPYVHFNKTDIRAYSGGVNTWGVWTGSGSYGADVDYAVYANQVIDGLRSYAANGSPSSPKMRSFANDTGTWGGNFGSTTADKFAQYVSTIGKGKACSGIPSSIAASTVINCSTSAVTIGSNIDTGWTSGAPRSLYIIADTINISGNVSTLKGVALIAHTINTCSDGANGCGNQLNFTGLLNATTIRYNRAANNSSGSSLNCARPGAGTTPPGTCGPGGSNYGHPGETITYSPEFEVSAAPYAPTNGPRSGKYDSIRSLPPIY